ncbi:MAG: M4 family metallopeptidase [Actinomycetota bacterium]
MGNLRSCIHCIVPPMVLEAIARNGSEQQRDWALRTMATDHSIRAARIQNSALRAPGRHRRSLLEAHSGTGKPHRIIRDSNGLETFAGPTVREEGQPATGDPAVDEAYDGFGATHDFFWKSFQRDSIDDDGMHLSGVVHYGNKFDNAFWDGQRMVFGDGDGEIFNRFTLSLDVIAHELAHGVTEDEAALVYLGQAGALNESMSDVFGSMVKQHMNRQKAADADWLIGAELLTGKVNGAALRSMKEPGSAYDDDLLGKDPQPGHMDDYVETMADNGGVHINSGIPNRAFYTVATALGGFAWERAGRIWYDSLRFEGLRPNARFSELAKVTEKTAKRLYGAGSDEAKAVKAGWDTVGVGSVS